MFENGSERKQKREDRTVIVRSVCMQSQCTIFNIYHISDLFRSFFKAVFILIGYLQRSEILRFQFSSETSPLC